MNANPLAINLLPSIFAEAGLRIFAANKLLMIIAITNVYLRFCFSICCFDFFGAAADV